MLAFETSRCWCAPTCTQPEASNITARMKDILENLLTRCPTISARRHPSYHLIDCIARHNVPKSVFNVKSTDNLQTPDAKMGYSF